MSAGNGHFTQDSFVLTGFYRGTVLDVTDPSQFGRVKIRVHGVFPEDIPTAQLPWAVPAQPMFSGAGSGYGYFAVPEVDSEVFVFFEAGSLYQPVYFAEAPSGIHGLPTERTTNYPLRKVWKTKNGISIVVDDSDKEIIVTHPQGTIIKVDSDGDVSVTSVGDVDVTATGNVDVSANGDVDVTAGGDADITATGDITITGAAVKINP